MEFGDLCQWIEALVDRFAANRMKEKFGPGGIRLLKFDFLHTTTVNKPSRIELFHFSQLPPLTQPHTFQRHSPGKAVVVRLHISAAPTPTFASAISPELSFVTARVFKFPEHAKVNSEFRNWNENLRPRSSSHSVPVSAEIIPDLSKYLLPRLVESNGESHRIHSSSSGVIGYFDT